MKKILLIICLLGFSIVGFSQIDYYEQPDNKETKVEKPKHQRKFLIGGNVGLSFGTYTRLLVAPKIAYPIKWFTIGAGLDGLYYRLKGYRAYMYGGNIFSEITFLNFLVAHVEVLEMNVETFRYFPNKNDRAWNTGFYVGLGYKQRFSERAYVNYIIMWDLNYTDYSPYSNPIFRFTFYF